MRICKAFLTLAVIAGLLWTQRGTLLDLADTRTMSCEEKIYTALMDRQESIVLAGYRLTETELQDIWSDTIYQNGELFFVSEQYEYTMFHDTVLTVLPQYAVSGAELDSVLTAYDAALQTILDTVDPAWSDLQKALYLHDYLCMHFRYDESQTRYSAPELLLEGLGVCQSYTQVYSALLNACGIPSDYLLSREMNHTWNIITLDGVPYHVDITYDDPTADRLGRARHTHFLVSDAVLTEDHSFTAEEGLGLCTDTTYDDAIWRNASSSFVPIGSRFYFIERGTIHRWDGNKVTPLFTIYATWFTDRGDNTYWKGNYSSLWEANGRLLYNTPDKIMVFDPDTGVSRTAYTYHGSGSIFGFSYIEGRLTLQIATDPNVQGEYISVPDFSI